MHIVTRAKLGCNVDLGIIGGDSDADADADADADGDGDIISHAATSGCDYVVALETDNTLEIISSEDGQLVNVICPELCREQLHQSLLRAGSAESAGATSGISVKSSVNDAKRRKRRRAERRAERKKIKAMDSAARRS